MNLSKQTLIVGRFNNDGKFVTKTGVKTLRLQKEAADSHTDHFLSDEAKLGNYAIVRGVETKTLIKDAEIINVLDTIPSQLLAALLRSKEDEPDAQRSKRVGDLSDRILKELPEILGVDPEADINELDENTKDIIPLKKRICAVVVGHSEQDKGAASPFGNKTQEWDYNSVIASLIKEKAKNVEIEIVFRKSASSKDYKDLPLQVNQLSPDMILSLHCNSAGASAYGTEMIYCPGSTKGKKLGEYLYNEVCAVFGRSGKGRRGVKTPWNGRGMNLLSRTKAPAVIAEPYFLSNKEDMRLGLEKMGELADAYVRAIEAYAVSIVTTSNVKFTETTSKLSYQGLNKKQFLQVNAAQIDKMRKSSNTWAKKAFGNGIVELTIEDIYIISNGEMGIKSNGNVDTHFGHSAGEIGLYPLPENLSYWLDTKTKRPTPPWNKAHSVEKNVQAFFDYMVSLKNKHVKKASGIDLYKGLFRMTGIKGDMTKEAEMLASVVHGYFYSGVYSDKKVPIKHIAEGIKKGTCISIVMKNTTYKYANSNILLNREKNIKKAIRWLDELPLQKGMFTL